jgi:CheY-like chemotaxis protein/HPt (histidine-containing phosphotransfer) domain-containing protein
MTATKPDRSPPGAPTAAPATQRRVLVAEDNKLNSVLIAEQLRAIGFEAEIHCNGRDALERWRSGGFAAVLTDINMPGMDGFELARAIRSEEAGGAHTPVIALTADAFLDKSTNWKAAGVDACLTKPIELASLKAALERWMTTARAGAAPDASALAGSDAPVNRATLPTIVGDDPRVIADFMARFARALQAAAATMAAALHAGNHAELASQAHQLRAGAGAAGAARLCDLCARIESAALAADDRVLAAEWQACAAEVGRVAGWISAQGNGAEPGATAR